MRRNALNSPRLLGLKKKRRMILIGKVSLFLLGILVIFAGLVYLYRRPILNISSVEIKDNTVADSEKIREVVEKDITGNYLWFFPKTNIFFYPKNKIRNELLDEFKGLGDVAFSIQRQALEISISERTAAYTWCGSEINLVVGVSSGQEKCYFMDGDGFIFAEAPYFSGEIYFKFYGPADLGTYFSKGNFKQLIYFKNTLATMGLKPIALHVLGDGDIKIFLVPSDPLSTKPYIILKSDSDFETVAENLQAAISTEPLMSNLKNKYSSLEYIDLRFGNKVYYKFQ